MKGIQNLFKLTFASLAVIPVSRGVGKTKLLEVLFTSQQKLLHKEVVISQNNQPLVFSQIRTFSNKGVEEKFLPIPTVKTNEKGAIYYCLSTKGGKNFPSVIVQENGREVEYNLPGWYSEWVLCSWAMNDSAFPSWVEFGKLVESNRYFAEFLDDNKKEIKVESQEQQKIVDKFKEMWLEAMKKRFK